MNIITLTGRTVRDPEKGASGKYADVTIAVQRGFAREGEQDTDFFNVRVLGDKRADFLCKHFPKGKPIGIVGEMHADQYEKDGQKQTFHRVIASDIDFLPQEAKKGGSANIQGTDLIDQAVNEFVNLDQDEMPF